MNYKKLIKYFAITYLITWFFWGIRALLTTLEVTDVNSILAWILYALGSLGPTITAILMLEDKSFKGIMDFIFKGKKGTIGYLLFFIVAFSLTYYCSTFKIIEGQSVIMLPIVLLVLLLVGGGNEELGWRGIVQPELEKKYSTFLTSVIISVPWALWHLPFWFTKGDTHTATPFILFFLVIFLLSISTGAIKKKTDSVFYCCVMHAAFNLISMLFAYDLNAVLIIGIIIIIASSFILSRDVKGKQNTVEEVI